MNKDIQYEIGRSYKRENAISITACVSRYKFYPNGAQEDWIAYAENYIKEYPNKPVDLFYETQDKETGYCSKTFIKSFN